jgi:hypothetical protein
LEWGYRLRTARAITITLIITPVGHHKYISKVIYMVFRVVKWGEREKWIEHF